MKLVPIINAILHAKEETDVNTGIGDPMMFRWAKKAELRIGVQRMHRKLKVITLESNYLDPPDDAIFIKYIYDGNAVSLLVEDGTATESTIEDDDDLAMAGYVWTPLNEYYLGENMWDVQGSQIIFDTSKVGSEITLEYLAFPTNDHDDILVTNAHIDAISFYIQYRIARTFRWKMMRSPNMMRSNELLSVREMKEEWKEEMRVARGEDSKMTPFDKKKIDRYLAELTGSFIHNFE